MISIHDRLNLPRSNTIINPWTVMIKPFNAHITHITMPGSITSDHLTSRTYLASINYLCKSQEIKLSTSHQVPGGRAPRHQKEHHFEKVKSRDNNSGDKASNYL